MGETSYDIIMEDAMSIFKTVIALPEGKRPATPMFVIPDTHGMANTLQALLAKVLASRLPDNTELVFLGDYGDTGPDTKGVVELALEFGHVFLMGNHDAPVVDIMTHRPPLWTSQTALDTNGLTIEQKIHRAWLGMMGGKTVLDSYGVRHDEPAQLCVKMPTQHQLFYKKLKLWHQNGDVVCVHAGIERGKPMTEQAVHTLLWDTKPLRETHEPLPFFVVYGHKFIEEGREPRQGVDCLGIDFGVKEGGPLAGLLILPNGEVSITFAEHADRR